MMNEIERRLYRRETQLLSLIERHPGAVLRDLALGLGALFVAGRAGRLLRAKRPA